MLQPWINPTTGRPTAISNDRLRNLVQEHLPIRITGDPIQYQINRTPDGWVVELINNRGVTKFPDQPAITDATAVARVRLQPKAASRRVREWRSMRADDNAGRVDVELGPGAVEFIEFRSRAAPARAAASHPLSHVRSDHTLPP
jgi:hypothetical protein